MVSNTLNLNLVQLAVTTLNRLINSGIKKRCVTMSLSKRFFEANMMLSKIISTIVFLFITQAVLSQEVKEEEKEAMKGSHGITVGLGHTQFSKAKNVEVILFGLACLHGLEL
jgi:hypothetical protein